ncbi:MAG: Holliday junction branch migration protein RuvA [Bacilli bacterium]|nr:Holliday junction branch migration protein RuvA [Bacilli bacterium]
MYSYMKGFIKEQEGNYIVLENHGIGYQIFVSNPFQFKMDEEVKVYLYNQVREDENSLYGFSTKEEKELFLKLINVKGVGPKLVMPMFASGSVSGIIDAIDRENILYLKKFPKVGEKVARQIILDLKGKLATIGDSPSVGGFDELVSVLEGLGYKLADIKKVLPNLDSSEPIETQVKDALKYMLK